MRTFLGTAPYLWVKHIGWASWYQVSEVWDEHFSIVLTDANERVINDSFRDYSIHTDGWLKKIIKEG